LDTAEKSTGNGGKKKGPAQLRVFNLGNKSLCQLLILLVFWKGFWRLRLKGMLWSCHTTGMFHIHANISYAQKEFGYKPATDLQTGLKKFVRWYLSYYGDKNAVGRKLQLGFFHHLPYNILTYNSISWICAKFACHDSWRTKSYQM
jgi:UDP-glucuronate 4-epimerase